MSSLFWTFPLILKSSLTKYKNVTKSSHIRKGCITHNLPKMKWCKIFVDRERVKKLKYIIIHRIKIKRTDMKIVVCSFDFNSVNNYVFKLLSTRSLSTKILSSLHLWQVVRQSFRICEFFITFVLRWRRLSEWKLKFKIKKTSFYREYSEISFF